MIVVGGIYHELCRDPRRNDLFGSGLRAAFALSNVPTPPKLCSVATAEDAALVGAKGIGLEYVERPSRIQFRYDTPISRPTLDYHGPDTQSVNLEAKADSILAFGMVETKPVVSAEWLVIDPQSPGLTELTKHIKWSAERLAIVGNQREILGLASSGSIPIQVAAEQVRNKYSAEIVIAKCGPRGAILVDDSGCSLVDPYPTKEVWPIGSGDVFSALFAWYWAEHGKDPLEASRLASLGTATWCSRGALQVVRKNGDIILPQSQKRQATLQDVRIYLAGPFFNYGERWLVDLVREGLRDLGAEVFSPFHDVGIGSPSEVAPADIKGLENCNAVFALLDGVDSGTLFEVGYAKAKGIPVVGFAERPENPDLTMLLGTDVPVYSDLAQATYHAVWDSIQ